jgi:hypothetical protein
MEAHLTPRQLRELFLFADLDDEQLDWIAGCGDVVEVPAGRTSSPRASSPLLLRAAVGHRLDEPDDRR